MQHGVMQLFSLLNKHVTSSSVSEFGLWFMAYQSVGTQFLVSPLLAWHHTGLALFVALLYSLSVAWPLASLVSTLARRVL